MHGIIFLILHTKAQRNVKNVPKAKQLVRARENFLI